MNVSQLKQFCRDFSNATETLYGEPYNFLVYSVGGRFYWITIVNVSTFPASYLKELVEWSYQKVFSSLAKARQLAIRAA